MAETKKTYSVFWEGDKPMYHRQVKAYSEQEAACQAAEGEGRGGDFHVIEGLSVVVQVTQTPVFEALSTGSA